MKRQTKHAIEYFFFRGAAFFVQLVPLRWIHTTGFMLARIAYPILKSRRKVARENLRYAFPEMTESERERIAARSFQSVSAAFIELLWYPNFTKESIRKRVQMENPELLEQLQKRNKGVVFLTAHYGNWELASQAIPVYTNTQVCTIAKQQSNLRIDRMITEWRELFGIKITSMGMNVREILRSLQNGKIVTLVADQSAPKESVAVTFFGREVPTFQGPAIFSLRTGAPLLIGCTMRQSDGNYSMRLYEIQSTDLQGASEKNILELTKRHVRKTEEIIRMCPEQWMWMHKRWKHAQRPDESAREENA